MTVLMSSSAEVLLRDAQDRIYRWPAGFRGFAARLRLSMESGTVSGMVWVTGTRGLAIDLDDGAGEEEWEWGVEQLRSLVMHRWPQESVDTAPAFDVRYADGAPSPRAGAADGVVVVEDPMRSTYRIREGHIAELARQLPTLSLRVLIRDRVATPDGRWLPRHSTTVLSDPDGTVRAVDVLTDSWQVDAPVAWPTRREVVSVVGSTAVVRTLELSDHHELLPWRDRAEIADP